MTRPNILWISTHDINPHLGTYAGVWPGADQAVTPRLDRLAAEGARFDKAFATAPVCAPSRSSIYTGCYPTAIGTMHMRSKATPPEDVRLLPEIFREAGYYTTNNWFMDFQMDVPPTTFDELGASAHWRGRADGQPFFAAFHGMVTHESSLYADDERYAQMTAAIPASARRDPATVELPPYYPDAEPFRVAWARYLELITAMDQWVAGILAELEEDGLAENTIVVFWSDHGLGMPRAKRWATEAGLREPLIMRWPGRIAPGTSVDALVSLMDLAPTMLSLCGLPVPETMHGKVVVDATGSPIDVNEYVFGGRDRMDEQEDTSRTVRDARFRLVRHEHPDRSQMQYCAYPDRLATWAEFRRLANEESEQLARGEEKSLLTPLQRALVASSKPARELYDIVEDPFEERNLAEDPAYADDVARLENALDDWQATYGDLGLIPEDQLIESWRPGGSRPPLNDLAVEWHDDGTVTATCSSPGARIGWTDREPEPVVEATPLSRMLGLPLDDRRWRMLTGPVRVDRSIFLRAWRPGFEPSAEVVLHP